ncbi:HpcH/HpaI aldolase/citrate lyase family protein [Amycolatopsis pithecellobii]|uniref:HpcH/HpaI aldolase/citrate lyase family protein n=1 Tax=Amycolatopsis pithecellobii TaxID=664692 RepID=UPI0028AB0305|nr:CoA ester lyase [Amycolatopsis pithecellobii]
MPDVLEEHIANVRSWLYVPGSRPDRFAKAAASAADDVVLDLEDSVAPGGKREAREHVLDWLADGHTGIVRINGSGTEWHDEDLEMVVSHRCPVILPKATNAAQVSAVIERLGQKACVIPLIETAVGVAAAQEICGVPGVRRVIFGSADFARDIGIDHLNRTALVHARCAVVLASAVAGIAPPMDGACTAIYDDDKLREDAEHAASLGFGGKSCIHPRQIPIVQTAFSPSTEEVEWARGIVAASGDGSISRLGGELVGRPVVERARRLLARCAG